jgi:hypothetical protein
VEEQRTRREEKRERERETRRQRDQGREREKRIKREIDRLTYREWVCVFKNERKAGEGMKGRKNKEER